MEKKKYNLILVEQNCLGGFYPYESRAIECSCCVPEMLLTEEQQKEVQTKIIDELCTALKKDFKKIDEIPFRKIKEKK